MRRLNKYSRYIHEYPDWPKFKWDDTGLIPLLTSVRNLQGRVIGKMGALGFELQNQANLEVLTQDVLKSNEIEGEILDQGQVRSSLARRLGLNIPGLVYSDRNVDGVVEMMIDATWNFDRPLTQERLYSWHNALFPTGYSGLYRIIVGSWRDDSTGPMQVVSGPMGKEKVHYQAPAARSLDKQMDIFFGWINDDQPIDLVVKAALAHLWFVTLHPFEDGNGRIARAITDMILARSDNQSTRFYSMSSQIRDERNQYYNILEETQKGGLNITAWMEWFLNCLKKALKSSDDLLSKVIFKHEFWIKNASRLDNPRQKKVLNKLLDGFEGKLTTSKWARIGKCSQDTALRDIQDLMEKEILCKLTGGGRSTGYDLKNKPWD